MNAIQIENFIDIFASINIDCYLRKHVSTITYSRESFVTPQRDEIVRDNNRILYTVSFLLTLFVVFQVISDEKEWWACGLKIISRQRELKNNLIHTFLYKNQENPTWGCLFLCFWLFKALLFLFCSYINLIQDTNYLNVFYFQRLY